MPRALAEKSMHPMMSDPTTDITTAIEALHRLEELHVEERLAEPAGLLDDDRYILELREEIESTERLYVGLAVTEIATLRGELADRLQG